jgi:hypothetical protein
MGRRSGKRASHGGGRVNKAFERIIALDGMRVWASLTNPGDPRALTAVRTGTLQLPESPCDAQSLAELARDDVLARIVDADALPLVTLLGGDTITLWNDLLSAELRPSLRIDVLDRPFPQRPASEPESPDFERTARELAAELEAGFRGALLLQPAPLLDKSVRFAVGHAAATLYPGPAGGMRLVCIGSEVRFDQQFAIPFVPARGALYAFEAGEIERLAADIRAFLSNRRERFAPVSPPAN